MEKIKFFIEWDFHSLMKTFRIMRITVFLLLCSILQTFANGTYSQKARPSLDFSKIKPGDALEEIEKNPEFFLSENEQQQNSVSGKVTDESGQPLPGVSVIIKGTSRGMVTDMNGNYTISGIPENAILVFSFLGMKTQEVVVGKQININVTLKQDFIGLDEVVAIGYGTMKKRDLTGAISSVNVAQVAQSRPTNNLADALQGKAAGVRVTQLNGDANQNTTIQIRGINSITSPQKPLIVINGIPSSSTSLNEIESSDIQSLEILKDASAAAIYGSRGAAGVILITTKKGVAGKSTLDFNYSYSCSI